MTIKINTFDIQVSSQTATEATTAYPCLSPALESAISSDASGTKIATVKAIREYLTHTIDNQEKLEILSTGNVVDSAYGDIIKSVAFNESTGNLNINYKTIKPTSNRIKIVETEDTLAFNYINERTIDYGSKIQGGSNFDETAISFESEYFDCNGIYTCAFTPANMLDVDHKIRITHNLCSNGIAVDVYASGDPSPKLLKSQYVANCSGLNIVELDLTNASGVPVGYTGIWRIIVMADDKLSRQENYLSYYGRYDATNGNVTLVDGTLVSLANLPATVTNDITVNSIYPYFTVSKKGTVAPSGSSIKFEVNDTIIITNVGLSYVLNDNNWAPPSNTAYTKLFDSSDLVQQALIVKHKLFKTPYAIVSVIDNNGNIVDPSDYEIKLIADDVATIDFGTDTISGTWRVSVLANNYKSSNIFWNVGTTDGNISGLPVDSSSARIVNVYDANENLIDVPVSLTSTTSLQITLPTPGADNFRVVIATSKLPIDSPFYIFGTDSYISTDLLANPNAKSRMATKLFRYSEMSNNSIKFNHGLDSIKLIVEVYDTQKRKVLPGAVRLIDKNNIIVLMPNLNQYSGIYTIVVLVHGDLNETSYRVRYKEFSSGDIISNTVTILHASLNIIATKNIAIGVIDTTNYDYVECGYTANSDNIVVEVGSLTSGIITIACGGADNVITQICENGTSSAGQFVSNGSNSITNPFTSPYKTHANIINITQSDSKVLPTELITGKDFIQVIQPSTAVHSIFVIAMDNTAFYKDFTGWSNEVIPICANMHNHLSEFTDYDSDGTKEIADFIYSNWSYDIATAKIDVKFLSETGPYASSAANEYYATVGLYPDAPDYFGEFAMKELSISTSISPSSTADANDYGAWSQLNYQPQIETNQYAWFEEPATLRVYANKIKLKYSDDYNDFTPIKLRMFYDKVVWGSNVGTITIPTTGTSQAIAATSIVTIEYDSGSWSSALHAVMTMFNVTTPAGIVYYGDKDNRITFKTTAGNIIINNGSGLYTATDNTFKVRLSYRNI